MMVCHYRMEAEGDKKKASEAEADLDWMAQHVQEII